MSAVRGIGRLAGVLAAGVAMLLAAMPSAGAQSNILIGGGSTFAALEFQQWRADAAKELGVNFDYSALGSGYGRQAYLAGQLKFGVSDIPFQSDEASLIANSGQKNFTYVPTTAGALAIAFSVTGTDGQQITSLKASQRNVCRLMTEEGMKWSDPELVAENPGVPLPDTPVGRLQRDESSGETFLFSQFCIATAPDVWAQFVALAGSPQNSSSSPDPELLAGRPTSRWPSNVPTNTGSINGADNLANQLQNAKSGVGFMALGYAKQRNIPVMQVRNAAGVYLSPTSDAVSKALTYAVRQADGTFKLNYVANDPTAYFPSTYSYAIVQTDSADTATGLALSKVLNYVVTKGQLKAVQLGYVRLSAEVIDLSVAAIQLIPGAEAPPTNYYGAISQGGIRGVTTPPAAAAAAAAANQANAAAAASAAAAKSAAGKAGAAKGAASSAASTGAAAAAATATATDAAAAPAATTESAAAESELGADSIDMSAIEAAKANVKTAVISGDGISNRATLVNLLIGAVLAVLGLFGVGPVRRMRKVRS